MLKCLAYLISFMGLCKDYVKAFQEETIAVEWWRTAEAGMRERSVQLEAANSELERQIAGPRAGIGPAGSGRRLAADEEPRRLGGIGAGAGIAVPCHSARGLEPDTALLS